MNVCDRKQSHTLLCNSPNPTQYWLDAIAAVLYNMGLLQNNVCDSFLGLAK